MVTFTTTTIPPVFVLSSGRCGSTMISNILNRHPRVLSLSEFVSYIGISSFRYRRLTGDRMWEIYSRQSKRTRVMLGGQYEELLYPFDDPKARFTRHDVPPILCAMLPHLTERHDELFDELEPVVRGQPRQSPADHCRFLFEWLCRRFGHDVWVERSGGSLIFAAKLLEEFPDARVIHVYRDGREAAISMSRHHIFREIMVNILAFRSLGYDAMKSMARGKYFDIAILRLESLGMALFKPARLPYHKLTRTDCGTLWSSMIERGQRLFGHFQSDRLLNVRFEDMQAEPDTQIRRLVRFIAPALEDEAWLREACSIPRQTSSKFAQLALDEQIALTEACRPGLESLGYSL